MKVVCIIPARYGSTRFPGKPLVKINGKSMIQRAWLIATCARNIDEVYIATDDKRISDHVKLFGGKVIMASKECRNGTERIYDAIRSLDTEPDKVINFQGDAILTPPWILETLADILLEDASVQIVTPAVQLNLDQYEELVKSKQSGQPGGTTVTFDKKGNALYFSKSIIPFLRKKDFKELPLFRHIGIYGYSYSALKQYLSLAPTRLEQVEQLEQLRALEHGIPIKVVVVDYKQRTHWSIDCPEDVAKVEEIIKKEGELIKS